jgi:hypothetical protein
MDDIIVLDIRENRRRSKRQNMKGRDYAISARYGEHAAKYGLRSDRILPSQSRNNAMDRIISQHTEPGPDRADEPKKKNTTRDIV